MMGYLRHIFSIIFITTVLYWIVYNLVFISWWHMDKIDAAVAMIIAALVDTQLGSISRLDALIEKLIDKK